MEGEFFRVLSPAEFIARLKSFPPLGIERVPLDQALGRILAGDVTAGEDLPPCDRSSMDGYCVAARDVFGASESTPAYLEMVAALSIEASPDFTLGPGQCAAIVTGGCLPPGADCVVMVEHAQDMGASTIEMRRSGAPGDNVMLRGEDVVRGNIALAPGRLFRPQEIGLLAALGVTSVAVYRRPRVGIVSTGDELVPVEATPRPGQIRDVNSHTLAGLLASAGFQAIQYGLVRDDTDTIAAALARGLEENDVVLVSGGSSVGVRDLTIAAIDRLPDSRILAHGVAVSPGKPTILAQIGGQTENGSASKAVLGLPGQVTSAQVIMHVFCLPFFRHLAGDIAAFERGLAVPAVLARNVASKPGREDYIRVRLEPSETALPRAHPVLGKSGLLRTLVEADGLIRIPAEAEGLVAGSQVRVMLL